MNRVGAQESTYIPAKTYEGRRPGYVFTTRSGRTGYFDDPLQVDEAPLAKRAKQEDSVDDIVARAEDADVEEVDAGAVRKLLLTLEKRITRNRQLRVKYSDAPSKFVESEVDLDDAIKQCGLCAAAPELYGELARLGGVSSIVNLVAHENADVSASAVALLYDLTDAEDAADDAAIEGHEALVDALANADGFATLGANVARFDEKSPEEASAVHHTLGVFENVVDVGGEANALKICAPAAGLVTWLADRVAVKTFDANKLYAAELLAVLAGRSDDCARAVATPGTVDALLRACAPYRRKSARGPDEEECVENLFQALASALTGAPATAVPAFVEAEGCELMLRCVQEQRAAAACALRVLAAALAPPLADERSEATGAARRVVSAGGLKVLFPALAGRGAARGAVVSDGGPRGASRSAKLKRKRRRADEQRDLDEHVVSCVAWLCVYGDDGGAPDAAKSRLLRKFLERDAEKCRSLLDRYLSYRTDVTAADAEGRAEDAAAPDPGLARLARALSAGLSGLRLAAAGLAFCCVHSPAARAHVSSGLKAAGAPAAELANALAAFADDVGDETEAAKTRSATLRGWAGAIAALEGGGGAGGTAAS